MVRLLSKPEPVAVTITGSPAFTALAVPEQDALAAAKTRAAPMEPNCQTRPVLSRTPLSSAEDEAHFMLCVFPVRLEKPQAEWCTRATSTPPPAMNAVVVVTAVMGKRQKADHAVVARRERAGTVSRVPSESGPWGRL